ncbi:MAG TPA: acyl-CoA dehydrogenase family protein, partial [Oleiagrimonas sp.]|nr:acyl-CoA dehydrogenase family protein [Oleiagrimonas sp.]
MIPRTLFSAEHEVFRTQVRRFMAEEVTPNRERWEEQQHVDRAIWTRAGELGFLCTAIPEQYGGMGGDRLYSTIMIEEAAHAADSSLGFTLHSDIVASYILNFGTEAQKHGWLPKLATGQTIGAIAMTEPGTGSDLQAVKTTAVSDGDDYIINGSKIFITNGYLSDLVIVVAKTGTSGNGAQDISLILVEADRAGFSKGRPLKKIGMKGQDTCELFFENVRVPRSNLLGEVEGQG